MPSVPDLALEVLNELSNGVKRDSKSMPSKYIESIEWLYKDGFVSGIDESSLDGQSFIDLKITSKGLEIIKQHAKEISERENRESAYEKNYPMRAKIVIGVSVALLVAVTTFIFSSFVH